MPNIVQAAALLGINLPADGFLAVLYKINIAQTALRAAGITEMPDLCLCPAVKLVRSVQLLAKHGLNVPEAVTAEMPAKSAKDLPTELISQCLCERIPIAVDELHKDRNYDPEQHELDLYQRTELLDMVLDMGPYNSHLRNDMVTVFFKRVSKEKEYVQWIYDVRDSFAYSYGDNDADSFTLGVPLDDFSCDVGYIHHITGTTTVGNGVPSRVRFYARLCDLTLDDFVDSMTLNINLEHECYSGQDITSTASLSERTRTSAAILQRQLPRITKANVRLATICPEYDGDGNLDLSQDPARLLKILQPPMLKDLHRILPGLQQLLLIIPFESLADPHLLETARGIVSQIRKLPVQHVVVKSEQHGHSIVGKEEEEAHDKEDEWIAAAIISFPGREYVLSG